MSTIYDVAVVGAGPGGSAAAYYLARSGLEVLLVDRADFPRDKACGDGLTPRAVRLLQDMDVLEPLRPAAWRVTELQVVAPGGHSTASPIPGKDDVPAYSLIVPRVRLDNVLRECAVASGARFQGRTRVVDVERETDGVVVRAEGANGPLSFHARVAVLATGASVGLLLRMSLLREHPPFMLAARAYFECVAGPTDRIQLRFDGVPLPGYGWVFPLADGGANVGVGFLPGRHGPRHAPSTPRIAFDAFVQTPPLRQMLAGARQAGPVKGHPLRVDFLTAPTFGERVLLVGEAAGLVNPLTGEGIDYALESGQLAGQHLVAMFRAGDLSAERLGEYDRLLRQRFGRLFRFCTRLRDWFLPHPWLLDRLIRAAGLRPDLKMLLVNIGLGHQSAAEGASLKAVLRAALAVAAAGGGVRVR